MQWIEDLEREWTACRSRLQRVRNALAHGGPVTDAAVSSIQPFGRQLAAWSLSTAFNGLLDGTGIQSAHDKGRMRALRWRRLIASGANATVALYS